MLCFLPELKVALKQAGSLAEEWSAKIISALACASIGLALALREYWPDTRLARVLAKHSSCASQ